MKLNLPVTLTIAALLGTLCSPLHAATYTVQVLTDGNSTSNCSTNCSLREAIIAANNNPGQDTINLSAGTHTLTLNGSGENNGVTGDLDITGDLIINGASVDQTQTVISGITGTLSNPTTQLDDRIFHILGNGATVQVRNLTISNGLVDGENGGAIFNSENSTLILDNVVVRESATTNIGNLLGQGLGGGIYNDGTLTIQNGSLITGNTANVDQEEQRASYGGGGLYNAREATISDTVFRRNVSWNNYTPDQNAEDFVNFSSGGAILNLGTLHIEDSLIGGETNIITESYKGQDTEDFTRNMSDSGAGISNFGGFLTISNSSIRFNRTFETSTPEEGLDPEGRAGGGIFAQNAGENRGSVLITATTIDNNYADRIGGGIFNSGSPLTITHSTISHNQAFFLGAGITNVGNQAAEISSSTIAYNHAKPPENPPLIPTTQGGGIHTTGRINITSSTIAGNDADQGAQMYLQDNSATDDRGLPPQITLTNSIIDHHQSVITIPEEVPIAENNCVGNDFIQSQGYNVDSGDSCGLNTAFSDISNSDPLLETFLADNPGDQGTVPPTRTIAFRDANNSPAVDIRDGAGCPSRDQRYFERNGRCDAGAFEHGATERGATLADLKVIVREGQDPAVTESQLVYTITVTNIGPDQADSVTLNVALPTLGHTLEDHSDEDKCGQGVNNNLFCNLGNIPARGTEIVSATLIPTEAGTMEITAEVTPADIGVDYFQFNNSFTESTEIQSKDNCDAGIPGCPEFVSSPSGGGGGGSPSAWLIYLLSAFFGTILFNRKFS